MAGRIGCIASGRVSHAVRSTVALAVAAVVAFQQGLTRIELPFASFAAFVAILCADATIGGTVRLSVDVSLGALAALLVHAPLLALPAFVCSSEAFAAPLLFAQCFVLAAPAFPNPMRRIAIAVGSLLTLAPIVTPLALDAGFGGLLLATVSLGAGSALCAALLPPWSSARAAFDEQRAEASAQAVECFQCLLLAFGAYCSHELDSPSSNEAPRSILLQAPQLPCTNELHLVRAAFLLRELERRPGLLAQLREEGEWEPTWPRWGGRRQNRSEPRDLWTHNQQRHLRSMERALRALADTIADGTHNVHSLHRVFAAHLRAPFARLSEQAGARVRAGENDRRYTPTGAQVEPSGDELFSVAELEAAFCAARAEALYAPEPPPLLPPVTDGFEPLARQRSMLSTTSAYALSYSRVVNPFVLSVILFCSPLAPAAGAGGGEGGLLRAVRTRARAAAAGCAPSQCSARRGVQFAVAVCAASVVVLLPQGRAAFPSSVLYAPVEAILQLMERAGASVHHSVNRLLGTTAGAVVAVLTVLATAELPADGWRQAAVLLCLSAWVFASCLNRRSRSNGYAFLVAAWTAPIVASDGGSANNAFERCAMALLGAAAGIGASSLIAPLRSSQQVMVEAAVAVVESASLLAQELKLWRSLLGFEDEEEATGDSLPLLHDGVPAAQAPHSAGPTPTAWARDLSRPPSGVALSLGAEQLGGGVQAQAAAAEAAVSLEALPLIVLDEREDAQRSAR
ncbi:hypothetical protein T492DRAFT_925233, partial [Pavlovales sp. CCMP2436]